ncbi:unnamed protein product [Acanthoscelides obtectus]|uniref:Uncharacterized protein n=1 Tax=Acanthoscelides obtectus TaxID=200917 RepID=A0A9P0PRC8_ACAOB|nr:unnamed protein product [Acanthoscelides obtectus]CAK1630846.1 hypothetical protein AOBTE_LOCUS6584 [Acanthoscelides obtectus]
MKWRQIITDYKLSGANKAIPKSDVQHLLKLVTHLLLESGKDNLISGFEKAGIYPLNRMKILERIPSIPMSRQMLVPLSSNYLKKEDFPVQQKKLQGKKAQHNNRKEHFNPRFAKRTS